jgi:hypothetical protein
MKAGETQVSNSVSNFVSKVRRARPRALCQNSIIFDDVIKSPLKHRACRHEQSYPHLEAQSGGHVWNVIFQPHCEEAGKTPVLRKRCEGMGVCTELSMHPSRVMHGYHSYGGTQACSAWRCQSVDRSQCAALLHKSNVLVHLQSIHNVT